MHAIGPTVANIVTKAGWQAGNHGENRVALQLYHWGWRPYEVAQQHRVGRYKLDFAWPAIKVGVEADGWVHRSDDTYNVDRQRDAWLRRQGWLIFRIDVDDDEHMPDQLLRVVVVVRALASR